MPLRDGGMDAVGKYRADFSLLTLVAEFVPDNDAQGHGESAEMARDGLGAYRSTSAPQAGGGCQIKPDNRCDEAIPTGADLPEIGQLLPTHFNHATY